MGEASWVKDWRKKALHLYETIEEPSAKDELYKYTPLSSLRHTDWDVAENEEPFSKTPAQSSEKKVEKQGAPLSGEEAVLYLDGSVEGRSISTLPKGVIFCPMKKAIGEHHKLLAPYWEGPHVWKKDKFAQQSYGKFKEGFLLHVDKNVQLKGNIRVVHAYKDSFSRNIIILEEGASLSLVEEHIQDTEEGSFHSGVTEFYVKKGARLSSVYIQGLSKKMQYSCRKYIRLEQEALMEYVDLVWGGDKGQERLEVDLVGEGAKITATVACRLDSEQYFGLVGNIRHHCARTVSDLRSYSVVADTAKATLNASVEVQPKAIHVQSNQRNKGLLLSKKASVRSMPKLLIATDEVNCSHGSSISHIEEDALYYLESRGIDRKRAIRMIVNTFIEPILREIPLGERKEWIASRLEKKSWGELV